MNLHRRIIFHVDVNSAFLSWSAVDRLAKNPDSTDLRTIPSAVGGDIESRHGIILAKSLPAKKYDIHTGEPVVQALRKCPGLVLVPPDFRVYNANSRAFIEILEKYAPVVEQVSIDEAFCDMTGTEKLYPSVLEAARRIKDEIRDTLGFTVNVGIAENKLLAKMASDMEKPDKIHTLYPNEIKEKMWPLPIGDLYGVGRSSREKFASLHIRTIEDAAGTELSVLQKAFGSKAGIYIKNAANGIDDSAVLAEREAEKSYGNSTTLPVDLTAGNKEDVLKPTLLALADSVASRMRKDGHKGLTVSVSLKTDKFAVHSRQLTLEEATDSTDEIYRTAVMLFERLWDGRTPVRLIGVTVSNLDAVSFTQMSLFSVPQEQEKKEKMKRLDQMTDAIRSAYGKSALTRARLLSDDWTKNVGRKND
ncbi:MAG TPA: DNA polymerase IV [Lachnospiraceae bacterium]|nr:DNA polymerase IV [Lachnospiraceae bacterium]